MKSSNKEYQNIHRWLSYHYEKPDNCPCCLSIGSRIEWALIRSRTHSKSIHNYRALCVKCHRRYDLKNRRLTDIHRENISKSKKGIPVGVGKVLTEEHKLAISKAMPKKINDEDLINVKKMYREGKSMRRIAKIFNTSHSIISKYLKK